MSTASEIVLVAAVARNGVIGRDNGLVFSDPADQRHFRATTLNCPVVMGRKTWDSLPPRFKPLPGRRNLVVSHQAGLQLPGAEVLGSLQVAFALVANEPRVCVIGGAQLYAQALPLAHTLVLTEVDADLAGDVHFPAWDRAGFVEASRQATHTASGVAFAFVTYRRR
jgi:dihydrofolate reductase